LNQSTFNFVFIHGTLQRSSVWGSIINSLRENGSPGKKFQVGNILTPDLYSDNPANLNSWFEKLDSSISGENNILIGYSLGGRFALELYKRAPSKYKSIVLICTDPGLEDKSAAASQLVNDDKWESRFREMDWDEMMHLWNALPTFCGQTNNTPPSEQDFDRDSLARLWNITSKARNPSLWGVVTEIAVPTLVVTGDMDIKFTDIGKRIKQLNPEMVEHVQIPDIGHRVPWEDREGFVAALIDFLGRIVNC